MKTYNPKSHAPAVYIPAWLIQVPSTELSLQAKILYGRLAQWANTKSCVHRSTGQLAEEMGVHQRVIKRFLAELRDVGLIETYQEKAGGENYYKFLDHKWIHADLLSVFDWSKKDQEPRDENVTTPVTKTSLPRDENVTPKVKEIKETKKEIKISCPSDDGREIEQQSFDTFWESYPRKEAKKEARKAWKKIKQEKYEQIISDVIQRKHHNWKGKPANYIPLPASYLNGERWNDQLFTTTGEQQNGNQAKADRRNQFQAKLEQRTLDLARRHAEEGLSNMD